VEKHFERDLICFHPGEQEGCPDGGGPDDEQGMNALHAFKAAQTLCPVEAQDLLDANAVTSLLDSDAFRGSDYRFRKSDSVACGRRLIRKVVPPRAHRMTNGRLDSQLRFGQRWWPFRSACPRPSTLLDWQPRSTSLRQHQ
jgi:hypothetical protein